MQGWTVLLRLCEWSRGTEAGDSGGGSGSGAAPFWMYMVHALLRPLQGFGNALVYGATRVLRLELAQLCARFRSDGSRTMLACGDCCKTASGRNHDREQEQRPVTPPTPTSLAMLAARGKVLEQQDGYNEL